MIVCSVEPHAEQRSGNRISGHVVVPGGNQPGQVKLDYVVARSARGIDAVQPHRPVETPCSRPACAENLSQRVSVQRLIPIPFVVYFWGRFRRRCRPHGNHLISVIPIIGVG
jgi:hypothetical protein